ncbi:MAG: response regulator [Myxococcales bacterium]|nr:response regulator [Myxococcales bacterium]
MRVLVCLALRRAGLDVIEATDGTALSAHIDRLATDPVDLIVTDVRMPGPSGLEVIEQLRCSDTTTPVIVMTAFADARSRQRAHALGATLLDKPFELMDLRALALQLLHILAPTQGQPA